MSGDCKEALGKKGLQDCKGTTTDEGSDTQDEQSKCGKSKNDTSNSLKEYQKYAKRKKACENAWEKKDKLECKEKKKDDQSDCCKVNDRKSKCGNIKKSESVSNKKSKDNKPKSVRGNNKESNCAPMKVDKHDKRSGKSKSSCEGKDLSDPFGRKPCPVAEKEIDCHESRKQFFKDTEEKNKECDKESKDEGSCTESKKGKSDTCGSSSGSTSSGEESESLSEGCQSKCSGQRYITCPKPIFNLTSSFQHLAPKIYTSKPCVPRVEKSKLCPINVKKSCVPYVPVGICPQLKPSSEFFCIDVRNNNLNECLRKYMTMDPSKVNDQCSAIAKRRRTVIQPETPQTGGLLTPRVRQIIRRWAPTAALYMGTTAVLTVWMTEWKAVLKHVPIIGHKEETEVKKPSTPMGENKHAVLSEGEEAKMRAEEEQKILDNSTIGSPNTKSDENGGAPAPA